MSHDFFPALGITGIFAGTALLAIEYFHVTPTMAALRQRLPNRVSLSSLLLFALITAWIWWAWRGETGFGRYQLFIGTLFNLLLFETFFVLFMRRIKSNTIAVMLAVMVSAGFIWFQRTNGSVWVYDLTFTLATLGATTLLIRMEFLRTRFLYLVAILWMLYDILSVWLIYPKIYAAADRPHISFFYPAVAVGNITLGSGDFMFLVLMTLVLYRDRGRWPALVHITIQSLALLITILAKPRDVLWPYLTIMVPIYLLVSFWARRSVRSAASVI